MKTCNRPPRGWYCLLERDHPGPCPGWPKFWTRIQLWFEHKNAAYLTYWPTRRKR